jgi:hypothetical protein
VGVWMDEEDEEDRDLPLWAFCGGIVFSLLGFVAMRFLGHLLHLQ